MTQNPDLATRAAMDLRDDEGFRAEPYRDTLGYLTIGYGFLIEPGKSDGIPRQVADFWLAHNIEQIIADLRGLIADFDRHPEPARRALINMAYQLGIGGLGKFRNMLASIDAGDYEQAAEHALQSRWAQQTPNRAQRVTDLLRSASALSA